MKATVLEADNNKAVILAEDGMFYNAEGSYSVGDIIEFNAEKPAVNKFEAARARTVRRIAAAAACLLMLLAGGLYSYQNFAVYADMTIDGDMPVKCSLNRKGEVISIEAVDESGEALAESMLKEGMKGKSAEEVCSYAESYIEKNADGGGAEMQIKIDGRDKEKAEKLGTELNRKYGLEPGSSPAQQNGSAGANGSAGNGGSVDKKAPERSDGESTANDAGSPKQNGNAGGTPVTPEAGRSSLQPADGNRPQNSNGMNSGAQGGGTAGDAGKDSGSAVQPPSGGGQGDAGNTNANGNGAIGTPQGGDLPGN